MIFFSNKRVIPKQGGGGGSPTWEKFPHFPGFFLEDVPDVTLADDHTNSMLADDVNRAIWS